MKASKVRKNFNYQKYTAFPKVHLPDRQWPEQVLTQAPQWCSVDLRDGNQALIDPMQVEQKERLFDLLVKLGFKQIEVGFPAASQPDYDFVRLLIEKNKIPTDVVIQVLTQARPALIKKTVQALQDCRHAIIHLYNSTSKVQREKVFGLSKPEIIQLAVDGVHVIKQEISLYPNTKWQLEYSPESFTGTELDFAIEICNAVVEAWQPKADNKIIINLPATVEMSTPNIFADQIEYFCRHIQARELIEISVHTHNDRGCAVAAAELAVMAGADRVEGTLLGNGERTGNMDIVTMAMNLYSQGIDPELDLACVNEIIHTVEACTHISTHPRHPYVGELVYTAFSGSHQDAIKKCLATYQENETWDIAYLPIDPQDLGRSYEAVIRINSQSGKGGVAYILENYYGFKLPAWLQIEFAKKVQEQTETLARELKSAEIIKLFHACYLQDSCAKVLEYHLEGQAQEILEIKFLVNHEVITLKGQGKGCLHALTQAIGEYLHAEIQIHEYSEHTLGQNSQAQAVTYIQLSVDSKMCTGVAVNEDVLSANLNAVLAALTFELERAHLQVESVC